MTQSSDERILKFYQYPALSGQKKEEILKKLNSITKKDVLNLDTEFCYNVVIESQLNTTEKEKLLWLLKPDLKTALSDIPRLLPEKNCLYAEFGPRLNFKTAFSTNAVAICDGVGFNGKINRIERSVIYKIVSKHPLKGSQQKQIELILHDRMTEQKYVNLTSFRQVVDHKHWTIVDILNKGKIALKEISDEMGLSFDEWDLDYYTNLFKNVLKRNPTSVECFDLAQSNSEHSRHWFFKGRMEIEGKEMEESLIDMVVETQKYSNDNNVIKFNDNSSAIIGFKDLNCLVASNPTEASVVKLQKDNRHIIFTAETHNFPTGVAPFQGATTGPGGRIRDVQAAGKGSHVIAGTAGYCIGNLHIPGYDLPWEKANQDEIHPNDFAKPLEISIQASNGCSDYGNKFGEPLINGFNRSFGQRLKKDIGIGGERLEYIKPILFSGGVGSIDASFVQKGVAEVGMEVVKVGGPVYRIGVGGGAASSVEIQGGDEQSEKLNFNAVQRGDPEMEQKMNRVIRACIENKENPIHAIHDQGAGGNGNVLKEIAEPKGAVIYAKNFTLGDPTIDTLELWGAEYQESNAILIEKKHKEFLNKVGKREKCKVDFVGEITGNGKITLIEDEKAEKHPVDIELEHVLGSMPRKLFKLKREKLDLQPLKLPQNLTIKEALDRVLRLPSVASKRFLTNKVDRCVTGLVAQQQCIGWLHTPLSDYGCIALSQFETKGAAISIGEQPIKGIISPKSGGQMTVAEAITNLMFCKITDLKDVKCSGNWMWAAKMPGEGLRLVETCRAMCETMKELGVAIDGGKDSLSMAAAVRKGKDTEIVKAPGTLVVSTYAPVPDINVKVTPLLSMNNVCSLIYVPIYANKSTVNTFKPRLGGSALAQVYNQIGNSSPSLDQPSLLSKCFNLVQQMIADQWCTAGHDVSDGGLITCLLEMSFGSNCGLNINLLKNNEIDNFSLLFAEECGVVIEVLDGKVDQIIKKFNEADLGAYVLGRANWKSDLINISINGKTILKDTVSNLRDIWEASSFELEKLQANPKCALQEREQLKYRRDAPKWLVKNCDLKETADKINKTQEQILNNQLKNRPRVAVLREEGINGDREMIASLHMVGFEVIDLTIMDLLNEQFDLNSVTGLVFPGGFSYADVLGSAKGWAGTIKFNSVVSKKLDEFKKRKNTWSLGVCNGCQLMALIGWVGNDENGKQSTLLRDNESERFECRFTNVKINKTKSIMLDGLEESVFGVWVAHGEGRFSFNDSKVLNHLKDKNLIALTYTDDNNEDTIMYPLNPNGSPLGIAGLVSEDGRHLAMMPHPERCTQLWQWPYLANMSINLPISPWVKMFRNAYDWASNNQ